MNQGAKGHEKIYIFVPVRIPDLRALPVLDYQGSVRKDSSAPRRRVHTLNK
jgi:hypothetical protein